MTLSAVPSILLPESFPVQAGVIQLIDSKTCLGARLPLHQYDNAGTVYGPFCIGKPIVTLAQAGSDVADHFCQERNKESLCSDPHLSQIGAF